MSDQLESMTEELSAFYVKHDLEPACANEKLRELLEKKKVIEEQITWLSKFVGDWESIKDAYKDKSRVRFVSELTQYEAMRWLVENDSEAAEFWTFTYNANDTDLREAVEDNLRDFSEIGQRGQRGQLESVSFLNTLIDKGIRFGMFGVETDISKLKQRLMEQLKHIQFMEGDSTEIRGRNCDYVIMDDIRVSSLKDLNRNDSWRKQNRITKPSQKKTRRLQRRRQK